MRKFDIRLRRQQFTQSRIERHKNYQSLMERHHEANKRKTRGIMVLVFLLILIIMILMAFFNTVEKPDQKKPDQKKPENEQVGLTKEINSYTFSEGNKESKN